MSFFSFRFLLKKHTKILAINKHHAYFLYSNGTEQYTDMYVAREKERRQREKE